MDVSFPSSLGNTTYEMDYYAGSQVLVFFEEVLVDDCVRIAWTVEQSRNPVYGYASQYFNTITDGVVIATGSLWIGFKEAAYIPVILRHVAARKGDGGSFFASPAVLPSSGTAHSTSLLQSSEEWEGGVIEGGARMAGEAQRASVERLLEAGAADPDDGDVQASLAQIATSLGALDDQAFEDIAELFEDALWYGTAGPDSGRASTMSGNYSGGGLTDEATLAVRRADQFPPFDIIITFGDINTPASNHTVMRIMDAVIVNTEFGGIEATGQPVFVRYDFLARNVI